MKNKSDIYLHIRSVGARHHRTHGIKNKIAFCSRLLRTFRFRSNLVNCKLLLWTTSKLIFIWLITYLSSHTLFRYYFRLNFSFFLFIFASLGRLSFSQRKYAVGCFFRARKNGRMTRNKYKQTKISNFLPSVFLCVVSFLFFFLFFSYTLRSCLDHDLDFAFNFFQPRW